MGLKPQHTGVCEDFKTEHNTKITFLGNFIYFSRPIRFSANSFR